MPEERALRAELATMWLFLVDTEGGTGGGAAGRVVERRFCRACAPSRAVVEVVCVYCGDGPLLADRLAGADPTSDPAVVAWLTGQGWSLTPTLVCPACRRAFERRALR